MFASDSEGHIRSWKALPGSRGDLDHEAAINGYVAWYRTQFQRATQ